MYEMNIRDYRRVLLDRKTVLVEKLKEAYSEEVKQYIRGEINALETVYNDFEQIKGE